MENAVGSLILKANPVLDDIKWPADHLGMNVPDIKGDQSQCRQDHSEEQGIEYNEISQGGVDGLKHELGGDHIKQGRQGNR